MTYPAFFDEVPRLRLYDHLSRLLGASSDGLIEFAYSDAVKMAGHSCPTVASAYWLTCLACRALFPDTLPQRGGLRVAFRQAAAAGVTGVMASVISLLTGAAGIGGFQGLAGQYGRRDLLTFGADLPMEIRFTRADNGRQVDVAAQLQQIPAAPEMPDLLQRCLAGKATADEQGRFAFLWQERVRRILIDHRDDQSVFLISRVS